MMLFIDETESKTLFIVAGLLIKSRQDVESAFRKFKKKASRLRIPQKAKSNLFKEFKSTLMDSDYTKLKKELMDQILLCEPSIISKVTKKLTWE